MINFIKNILNKILGKKDKRKNRFKNTLIVKNDSSIKAKEDTITIIKKGNSYAWVKFICPCGCGREIALSLNPIIKPCWNIKIDSKNKVTLSPSVHLTGFQCKSHFFIRGNNIDWV